MATTTALQIITDALGIVGVAAPGQDVEIDDSDLGLRLLNSLLDAWALSPGYSAGRGHLVYQVPGLLTTLTIGPGLTLNMARPVRIGDGYVRQGTYDYPFRMVSGADFDAIPYKGGGGPAPSVAYYNGVDTVLFAPPFSGGELHLPVEVSLVAFTALSSTQSLPQGYRRALSLTLAEEMAPYYSRELSGSVREAAANARRAIRRANLTVPTLRGWAAPASPIFSGAFDTGGAPSGNYLLLEDGSYLILEP